MEVLADSSVAQPAEPKRHTDASNAQANGRGKGLLHHLHSLRYRGLWVVVHVQTQNMDWRGEQLYKSRRDELRQGVCPATSYSELLLHLVFESMSQVTDDNGGWGDLGRGGESRKTEVRNTFVIQHPRHEQISHRSSHITRPLCIRGTIETMTPYIRHDPLVCSPLPFAP